MERRDELDICVNNSSIYIYIYVFKSTHLLSKCPSVYFLLPQHRFKRTKEYEHSTRERVVDSKERLAYKSQR